MIETIFGASPFRNPTSAFIPQRFTDQHLEITRIKVSSNLLIPNVRLERGQLEHLLLTELGLTHH